LSPTRVLEGRSDVPQAVRRAVEENRVGAAVGDTSRIVAANDHYLRIVGFTRAELDAGAVSWLRLTPPECLGVDARAIGELRSVGRSDAYEKEYVRRDRARVRVRIAPLLLALEPFRFFALVGAVDDAEAVRLVDTLAPR
jgi:PAS domain-containing protein